MEAFGTSGKGGDTVQAAGGPDHTKRDRILTAVVYAVFFTAILFMHRNMTLWGDDTTKASSYDMPIMPAVKNLYFHWSSRLPIEFVLMAVLKYGGFVFWKILDSLFVCFSAYVLTSLFGNVHKLEDHIAAILLSSLFPFAYTHDLTAWAAVTCGVIWPIILGFYAMIPIRRWWKGEKISRLHMVLYLSAFCYSLFLEQVCGVMLIGLTVTAVVFFRSGKKEWKSIAYMLLPVVAVLIFILTCPGDKVRFALEEETHFPDYSSIPIVQKLSMILGWTLYELYYMRYLFMIALFALLTLYLALVRGFPFDRRHVPAYFCAAFPLLIVCLGDSLIRTVPKLSHFLTLQGAWDRYRMPNENMYGSITAENYMYFGAWFPMLFSLFLLFITFAALFMTCEKGRPESYLLPFLFFLGLGSRCVLGISPSVWASGHRTAFLFFFLIIAISYSLCLKIRKVSPKAGLAACIVFLWMACGNITYAILTIKK
jgi:hypothetical protein